MADMKSLPPLPLPAGITQRYVDTRPHSLVFHVLEAGYTPDHSKPLIILIHGFPELAFSWRHMMPLLASKGYYVVAFDQRGFGRTFPGVKSLAPSEFRPLNQMRDVVILTHALGYTSVHCVVGHDFGSVTAALSSLARPDMFRSVVLMSHPTKGPPPLPVNTANGSPPLPKPFDMESALGALPRPRKHYKWYYCTDPADQDMTEPTSGLHEFLRGYFHLKSGDWDGNDPHPLGGWEAEELAKMPRYYIMDKADNMREAVARDMANEDPQLVAERSRRWLSDDELAVYVAEYARTTFQGGLNWYRVLTQPAVAGDADFLAGRKIDVPCSYVTGQRDWGMYQEPGALEAMEQGRSVNKDKYVGTRVVPHAGHWVNQEQPEASVDAILAVIARLE